MAIKVSQAFQRTSANPVDETMALTKAQMLTVNDNLMPDYYFTICQDDGQIYLYDKTATPSATTGKFTKFEGSGGGGSGSGVPAGGTTGQALVKKSNTDGDVEWKTPSSTQYNTMPTASSVYKDKIVQYVGATTGSAPIYKNGYFYKCIENTSVTPYTYSWQEIEVSEDKEGHTILDTDGNAKTQRGKLQFTGLDAVDDSTNNKTEVKPFGLNSDDLDEIINTSEISNGYVQSQFNYSLEEQVVGKWVDGKPVYQKTVACGALPNSTNKTVNHNISNLDYIIKWTGSASQSTGIHIKFPYVNISTLGNSCNVWIDKTGIGIETTSNLSAYTKSYVTLQYTKTTD